MNSQNQPQPQQPCVVPVNPIQRLSQSPAVYSGPNTPIRTATYTLVQTPSGFTKILSASPSANNDQQQQLPSPNLNKSNFRIVPRQMMSAGGQVRYVVKGLSLNTPNRLKMNMNGVGVRQQYQVQQQPFGKQRQGLINVGGIPALRMINPQQAQQPQQQQQAQPVTFKRMMVNPDGNLVATKKIPVVRVDSPVSIHSGGPASLESSPRKTTNTPPSSSAPKPAKRKNIQMRLRCRSRPLPLHATYFENNEIVDKDADVIFLCGDGGRVKAHRIILATQYKLLTTAFIDQPAHEISMVSVPDITSDTMKLIILLAYKSDVVINSDQIEKMKDFFEMFGIDFSNLAVESNGNGRKMDVKPGKVTDDIGRNYDGGVEGQRRKLVPSFTSQQLTNLQKNKTVGNYRPSSSGHLDSDEYAEGYVMDSQGELYSSDSDGEQTFKIQGYPSTPRNDGNIERRKSKLTPRIETETADVPDTETDETLLKEWIDMVGKTEPDPKRPRIIAKPKLQCKTCSATFFKESAWKWHQDRHVRHGIYKCSLCDELKTTARTIWNHEENVHNFIGLPLAEIEESPIAPQTSGRPRLPPQQQSKPKLVPHNVLLAQKMAQLKRMNLASSQANKLSGKILRTYKGFPQANHAIKIGEASESGELDAKKIKQLHWLYVCARCDNCSDSADKALLHFKKCYPTGESLFESTVTKYRQGFYGRTKCPLCPRKYVSNGGWTIHVGHQHQGYRQLFSHTGNLEDKLKCTNCNRKFGFPEEFHFHLHQGVECINNPINEESMPLLTANRSISRAEASEAADAMVSPPSFSSSDNDRTKKIQHKGAVLAAAAVVNKKEDKNTTAKPAKPQPVIPTPTPPRSARIAKRASALLMAKVLNDQEDSDDEKDRVPVKRRASTAVAAAATAAVSQREVPPADCPFCGESVANISQHLAIDHKDMDLSVERISEEDLKCCRCRMTFGIPDLFGHPGICRKASQKGKDEEANVSTPVETPKSSNKREKTVHEPIEIPAGVGSSSIDEMEYSLDELMTKEVLEKALKCPVCKKQGGRMGDISICLKQHGIMRCSLCFNTYSQREHYDQHMKKCHYATGSRAKCLYCPDKTFTNIGQCVGHLHNFHWGEVLQKPKRGGKAAAKTNKQARGVEKAESEGVLTPGEGSKNDTESIEDNSAQSKGDDVPETTEELGRTDEKDDDGIELDQDEEAPMDVTDSTTVTTTDTSHDDDDSKTEDVSQIDDENDNDEKERDDDDADAIMGEIKSATPPPPPGETLVMAKKSVVAPLID